MEVAERTLEEAIAATLAALEVLKVAASEEMVGDADLLEAEEKKALAEKAMAETLSPRVIGSTHSTGRIWIGTAASPAGVVSIVAGPVLAIIIGCWGGIG